VFATTPRKCRLLAQEAVAGMDCIAVALSCRGDHLIGIQVGGDSGPTQRERFIRFAGVERLGVVLGEDGDGIDAKFGSGANDADGNFTAVGNHETFDHIGCRFLTCRFITSSIRLTRLHDPFQSTG